MSILACTTRIFGRVGSFLLLVTCVTVTGCRESSVKQVPISKISDATKEAGAPPADSEVDPLAREAFITESRPAIESFCGDCHAMPRSASSAKDEWLGEIEQGISLYEYTGRTDLEVPNKQLVLKYFQLWAPEKLVAPESTKNFVTSSLPLQRSFVRATGSRPPGVTNVRWIDLGLQESPALVYCDINTGAVNAHWPEVDSGGQLKNGNIIDSGTTKKLATLLQPVHCEVCDLDQDGLTDLLVADIGEFDANDSDLGRVMWLRRKSAETEDFESIVLRDGLSRVADVQPGDFDGDGDTDVLVAEFGWRTTGKIFLLVNSGSNEQGELQFETRVIDERNGCVHVPTVDLDGDGDLDFVALISQEHEIVEAFLNDGHGQFEHQVIWRAPDPAYGSSGIQLVDMDADGDLDVLYTNGDSFDRGFKPHHSVQWLENVGSFPYPHHHVVHMPGVLCAKAGDFDGDGDMDIVACSLLAGGIVNEFAAAGVSSIVMLMQNTPGEFEPTQIEGGHYNHLSLEVADFDQDGHPDFAVGDFQRQGNAEQPDLEIYWNRP